MIISFQIDIIGRETNSEQCAKVVVNEDATKSKEEDFIGRMEIELNQ